MNSEDSDAARRLYLDLLKRTLTRMIVVDDGGIDQLPRSRLGGSVYRAFMRFAVPLYVKVTKNVRFPEPVIKHAIGPAQRLVSRLRPFDPGNRTEGRDWPKDAETMIGLRRLDNIQDCVTDVIKSGVPGDVIETGVWRGGATIFMAGILKAYNDRSRLVWVADSFEGLPKPNVDKAPADKGDIHYALSGELAVSEEQVRANFRRFGLLDERVCFLKGWFKDTLPVAPIERLSVIRLDGDMYESTGCDRGALSQVVRRRLPYR